MQALVDRRVVPLLKVPKWSTF